MEPRPGAFPGLGGRCVTNARDAGRDGSVKEQVYKDPRPAEHFTRFHERVRRGRPDWAYEFVRLVLTPCLLFFYRARCIDSDYVPADGPAIVAPNHFSFLDHFFVAVYLRRKVHFMAKSQLFNGPIQFIYTHGGVFPVRRGQHDEEAFKTADAILRRGGLIVMYAEGGRSRSGELGQVRPGIGRLALQYGVPIVPTAIAGTERVRNWRRFQFPKVTVQFGKPLRFEQVDEPTKEQSQAAAEIVFADVRVLHSRLLKDGRRRVVKAARAARRAAQAAGRRPVRG
jgi:1-acyl-sn-glycerol-3-phosphate acyltransferase